MMYRWGYWMILRIIDNVKRLLNKQKEEAEIKAVSSNIKCVAHPMEVRCALAITFIFKVM